jgi:uncharacterized protein
MRFEYDPRKGAANKDKHGLDFDEAQELWADGARIEFTARTTGESRHLTIGRIGGKLWAAIFTMRGEAVRLISIGRARTEERQWYEDNQSE